ncbi:UNVERIFIED_CONTAM: Retrovirus-related Pol polyprotein from transposon RE2 [Sesamum latifolium]|uniref:Retrovirus-related Pol polyprotein from transposon RE2 n=1 Tax=Sesamum latifolium TaxID=2727402 RepID=A0AAW2TNI7_9LAMI
MTDSYNNNSVYLAGRENRRGYTDKHIQKRKPFVDKRLLTCDHCHKSGHSKESCFKLFGVLDWYKTLPEQKKKDVGVKNFAATIGTSSSVGGSNQPQNSAHNQDTLTAMMAEMLQLMKDKSTTSPSSSCPLPTVPLHLDSLQPYSIPSATVPAVPSSPAISLPDHVTSFNPDTASSTMPITQAVRKSSRHTHPAWLDNFICHTDSSILYSGFGENYTWRLTPLPAGKNAIGCKWIYKTKLKADGSVDRYKARLVAKGFNQIEGIDYTESFSLVAKAVTVRIFLVLAASYAWPIQQLDINNAFLHGYLDEDLYMLPPEGYDVKPGLVCKLERSLYGLKQASRQWNLEFTVKLEAYGFVQSAHDYCLFTMVTDQGRIFLLVYVDDILITGPSLFEIQKVKSYLHNLFTIKDLGDARYFLGLEIARNSSGTYLAQTKYTLDIIKDAGLLYSKAATTPLPQGLKFTADCGAKLQHPDAYRRLIGRLLYLEFTRPDISHSVQKLSQFLAHPCEGHWSAALHIVKYLKGSPSQGIFLPASNNLQLSAFCDADWAACPDSRRSLTGFCVFLGTAPISWKTKKQSTVSRSTVEAEYRSLAATVCELRWVSYILKDLGVDILTPIPLFCDNKAALHIMANPVFHERTKHIEIDCHIVRDAYKDGFILPSHIKGTNQIADISTKSLPFKSFATMVSKLGLVSLVPSPTCGGRLNIRVMMQSLHMKMVSPLFLLLPLPQLKLVP